ncbi:olfactory receptor 5G3-like [Hyperolius riggenbachi]|uniref:olfactory receptor 5G3-like n=1 Tax=Hyperolius riggenbachi TaxID=752182 RepID=UPI0035A27334
MSLENNQTFLRYFILRGLSDDPKLQNVLFFLFLSFYFVTLAGNFLLIIVVRLYPSLQTPMYFFLSNLSFIDICVSTTVVPKILVNTLSKDRRISFLGCAAQMYFHLSFGATECLLLPTMAYDRYNAICNPLQYTIIMNQKVCLCLVASCWTMGFLDTVVHAVSTFQLPFCKSNYVNHFYCEMFPLLQLSCKDTWINIVMVYLSGIIIALISFLVTCLSYFHILSTIMKIQHNKGRGKAFSTCTSHLIVLNLYYGTILCAYMRPQSSYSPLQDQAFSILYTVVMPMLNPIIYSVRNKDIKDAIRKLTDRIFYTSSDNLDRYNLIWDAWITVA